MENQRNKKIRNWLSTRNPEHRQSYKRKEAVFKRLTRANKNFIFITQENLKKKKKRTIYDNITWKTRIQGDYINIDTRILEKALRNLINNKASGPEYIPAGLLKNGIPKLINFFTKLFTRYIKGEKIPLIWN